MTEAKKFPFDFEFYNETDLPDPEFYELAYCNGPQNLDTKQAQNKV